MCVGIIGCSDLVEGVGTCIMCVRFFEFVCGFGRGCVVVAGRKEVIR